MKLGETKFLINNLPATEEDWNLLKIKHKEQNTSAKLKFINYITNGNKINTVYNIITK